MNSLLHKLYISLFFLISAISITLIVVNGYDYYTTPIESRVYSDSHLLFKPSGTWGHGLGILGTLMMIVGVLVYMVRKRKPRIFRFGNLKYWLEFHIFMCTLGPILILFHTAFKFGGIVAISFWSMVAVVLSGVIGRFIYIQIPRTIQGQELSYSELQELNREFSNKLAERFDFSSSMLANIENEYNPEKYKTLGFQHSLKIILFDFFRLRKKINSIKHEIRKQNINSPESEKEIIKIVKSKIILLRRIGLLRTMQKLFNYWHIVHLPFAVSMFVIMIIHVAVTIIFGYKWIF